MADRVWNHSVFSRNRDRLLAGEVSHRFFARVVSQAEDTGLLSKEHFSVDGTLIEALASHQSHRSRDENGPPGGGGRNPPVDFHGEERSRDTHESRTDKDAVLSKKSKGAESKPAYLGHLLIENRHGVILDARVTQATGKAEREAAADLVEAFGGRQRITPGADKNCDTGCFVEDMREMTVTPHVARNDTNRASVIDGRTTRHPGYATSQAIRKRIEECFGWARTIGGMRKSRFIGREKLDFQFVMTFAADNLIRMRNLGGVAC
jgi:hypothetical protein